MTSSTASNSSVDDDDFDSSLEEFEDQAPKEGVYLKIKHQPCKYFRFRYASEMVGTHGFIVSNSKQKIKTYPTVELCNFSGTAIIKCALAQWDNDNLHVHTCCAKGLEIEATVGPEVGYTVTFQNLSIVQLRKAEVYERLQNNMSYARDLNNKEIQELAAKIELNKVRLKFSAHMSKYDDNLICPPVYSTVVNSQKHASTKNLKICRMSKASGSALGGDEIYLLVEKVVKDKVGVRMVQLNDNRETIWREDCFFNENDDVHFQYAIVVRTPPYANVNIKKPVKVFIELYRKNSSERSKRRKFTYHPEFPSHSYSSITNNESYHLGLPVLPRVVNSISSEPLLANIHESKHCTNELAFAEDYKRPLQVIDAIDGDILQFDTEEFNQFAANFEAYKENYYEDLDSIVMESNVSSGLMADGIVMKPKSSGISEIPVKIEKFTDDESSFEDSSSNISGSKLVTDGYCSDTTKLTTLVKSEIDIDIDEASLDSFVESDRRSEIVTQNNPSTSKPIDIRIAGVKNVAISTRKVVPQKTKDSRKSTEAETESTGHEFRVIDARLLDAISKDDEALLEDLLDDGLSPSVCDDKGNNAVHCAVNSRSCLPVLLKLCQRMIGEVINERNYDGKTALHLAALQNSKKKVKLLLSHSAKHDVLDDDGNTALHLACQQGHLEVVELLLESVVEMDVDAVNKKGQTALQIVCAAEDCPDNRAIIELLLEKGANVLATVIGNLSALQLTKDKPKMMRILRTYLPS